MDLLEEYIAYLKDNPQGYWFKRKLYGIGWVPARWQGWVSLAAYILFVFGIVLLTPVELVEQHLLTHVLVPILGATAMFLAVCVRMGEPLQWQWGVFTKRSKR
jgi:hypothetical protein